MMKVSDLYSEVLENQSDLEIKQQDGEYENSIGYESETLSELFLGYVERTLEKDREHTRKEASETLKNVKYSQSDLNTFLESIDELEGDVREIAENQVSQYNEGLFDIWPIVQPFIDGLIENYEQQELVMTTLEGFNLRRNHGKDITVEGDISAGPYGVESGEIVVEGSAEDEFAFDMKGGKIILKGDLEGTGVSSMRGGEVFINGDVASNLGFCVKNGYLEVGGDVNGNLGTAISGGEIIIKGDVEGVVGKGIQGGEIYVEGDVKSVCSDIEDYKPSPATGGEIRIGGEIGELAEENMQGVEVHQKQNGEWVELTGDDK